MNGKRTDRRRAKVPPGVWLIIGLTLFFGLGAFGIAAFIVLRALRAGKGTNTAEIQPARRPAATPVPEGTATPSPPALPTVQPPPPGARPSGAENKGVQSTPADGVAARMRAKIHQFVEACAILPGDRPSKAGRIDLS